MRRRRYLALVSVGVGALAGCAQPSRSGTDETTTEPTTEQTPTSTSPTPTEAGSQQVSMGESVTNDDVQVTVQNPRVRKAIATQEVHTRLVTPELVTESGDPARGQFVVVDVRLDGEPATDLEAVRLQPAVDGEVIPESSPLSVAGEDGKFAFPFPTAEPADAAIQWVTEPGPISWQLTKSVRETLGREPVFRVDEVAVSRQDGDLELDLTVTNDGERDGQFIARVSQKDFSGGDIVEFPVQAGETSTRTVSPDVLLYLDNAGGGTLTVQYPGQSGLETVEHLVEIAETTTESDS